MALMWYTVQVFTGQEQKIKNYLDTEIERLGIRDQIATVLIPSEEVIEMKNGKKKSKRRVFFPGYMLLESDLTKEIKHLILNTPSVINFVGPNNEPTPLSPAEVNRILGRVDQVRDQETVEVPFQVDDAIRVIDGPFKDFTGFIKEVSLDKRKLKVMVSIFGRSTPVELDFLQVTTDLTTS
ncbi:transcription termination/antitermination protein NusG [bacterium]|nr:transcription termination/antitermination protein NusG [bacterium]MBU1650639.1 transcription termination/antitermination protein NusG [bacterium]